MIDPCTRTSPCSLDSSNPFHKDQRPCLDGGQLHFNLAFHGPQNRRFFLTPTPPAMFLFNSRRRRSAFCSAVSSCSGCCAADELPPASRAGKVALFVLAEEEGVAGSSSVDASGATWRPCDLEIDCFARPEVRLAASGLSGDGPAVSVPLSVSVPCSLSSCMSTSPPASFLAAEAGFLFDERDIAVGDGDVSLCRDLPPSRPSRRGGVVDGLFCGCLTCWDRVLGGASKSSSSSSSEEASGLGAEGLVRRPRRRLDKGVEALGSPSPSGVVLLLPIPRRGGGDLEGDDDRAEERETFCFPSPPSRRFLLLRFSLSVAFCLECAFPDFECLFGWSVSDSDSVSLAVGVPDETLEARFEDEAAGF